MACRKDHAKKEIKGNVRAKGKPLLSWLIFAALSLFPSVHDPRKPSKKSHFRLHKQSKGKSAILFFPHTRVRSKRPTSASIQTCSIHQPHPSPGSGCDYHFRVFVCVNAKKNISLKGARPLERGLGTTTPYVRGAASGSPLPLVAPLAASRVSPCAPSCRGGGGGHRPVHRLVRQRIGFGVLPPRDLCASTQKKNTV